MSRNFATTSSVHATHRIHRQGWSLTYASSVPRELAESWLEAWSRPADQRPHWAVERRAELAAPALPGGLAVTKLEEPGALRSILQRSLGLRGRAARAFQLGLDLESKEIPAARPLALLEERGPAWRLRACLVLAYIPGKTLREHLLEQLASSTASSRQVLKLRLWEAIASAVARLHAAGVRQRDLKAPNIIVAGNSSAPSVHFIDLEGMRALGSRPTLGVRTRDLARLTTSLASEDLQGCGVNAEDTRELLRLYLLHAEGAAPTDAAVEGLLAGTGRWRDRKLARNRRHGRVTW